MYLWWYETLSRVFAYSFSIWITHFPSVLVCVWASNDLEVCPNDFDRKVNYFPKFVRYHSLLSTIFEVILALVILLPVQLVVVGCAVATCRRLPQFATRMTVAVRLQRAGNKAKIRNTHFYGWGRGRRQGGGGGARSSPIPTTCHLLPWATILNGNSTL